MRFTALLHHVTVPLLKSSFYSLKKDAAPGVDGVTWQEYETDLDRRLVDLHSRLHRGTYRAQPSRRVYIPKADGRRRPLGVAALEDKVAQTAVLEVLNQIYEQDFKGFSYGFRPGRSQHDALDALWVGLRRKRVNFVLDADIRDFFSSVSHDWLGKFLEHRIADRRLLRLIRKWLKAGVAEEGVWSKTEIGTAQGSSISPLLANIYLHYSFDLWAQHWRKHHALGNLIIVRYADDVALGFQYRRDADRFLAEWRERMRKFGLELHPDKTRLIEFGQFAARNRRQQRLGKPETFDFLGFTHICAQTRQNGKFTIMRKTSAKRMRAKLRAIQEELRRRWHQPVPEVGRWLRSVVQGYLNYHAIPGNLDRMNSFLWRVRRHWLRALRRRSQVHRMSWSRFQPLAKRWLPALQVLHPYPSVRFDARYPR